MLPIHRQLHIRCVTIASLTYYYSCKIQDFVGNTILKTDKSPRLLFRTTVVLPVVKQWYNILLFVGMFSSECMKVLFFGVDSGTVFKGSS